MKFQGDTIAAIIGATIGLTIAFAAFVYAPMKANYERNGCVFLECEGR